MLAICGPWGRGRQRFSIEFARDSLLEGTGFEPSVPRWKGPTLRVSVLFRSDFSVGENQPEAT
jgi:hypothetical protein